MGIKIYHGSPGSYKTSNCVYCDLPKFAFDGRVIVTNIRGLEDRNKIKSVLEKRGNRFKIFPWQQKRYIPESFDIINVEHETLEGKEKWARWFHWAPEGCVLFVDEAQRIWRKEWTAKQLHQFDYPGGTDKAKEDHRPDDFLTSFEMHRHYNWDFVLTAPSIKLIRQEIREIADGAYFHVNSSLIGFKGRFSQHYHMPSNNGAISDTITSLYFRKIPKWVFKLYGSTATGVFSDTSAGSSIFKNKKFLGLLFLMISLLFYSLPDFVSFFNRFVLNNDSTIENKKVSEPVISSVPVQDKISSGLSFNGFKDAKIFYLGNYKKKNGDLIYLFEVRENNELRGTVLSSLFFENLGYTINDISDNSVFLSNGFSKIFCKKIGVINDKEIF